MTLKYKKRWVKEVIDWLIKQCPALNGKESLTVDDLIGAIGELGGVVKFGELAEYCAHGKIEKKDTKFVIQVSDTGLPESQNFSLAHSLGHLCLHLLTDKRWGDEKVVFVDAPMYQQGFSNLEVEANMFAFELRLGLMEKKCLTTKTL